MKRTLTLAIATTAMALSSAAIAKTDWAKTALDPAKAYILVQIEPVEFKMMGNNKIVAPVVLAPYDSQAGAIKLTKVEKKLPVVARVVLREDAIVKDGKRRQFFAAVTPGTWVFEGAGGEAPTLGAASTAFALGSYSFDARAGEIIDLGVISPLREESDNPDTKMSGGKLAGMMLAGPFGGGRVEPVPMKLDIRPRGADDLPVPAWLAGKPLAHPAMTYGVTFANLLGGLVNRVDGKAGRSRAAGEVVYPSGPAQP